MTNGGGVRQDLLAGKHPGEVAAQREQTRLEAFCSRLRLPEATESVLLYLTWLAEAEGKTGPEVRRVLTRLDLAARLAGREAWSAHPAMKPFLRGLSKTHPAGPSDQRSEPAYRETLESFVDAVTRPTGLQLLDRAALLLTYWAGLTTTDIARLSWDHVRFSRGAVTITTLPRRRRTNPQPVTLQARHDALCLVAALRRLREADPMTLRDDAASPANIALARTHPFLQTNGRVLGRVFPVLRLPRENEQEVADALHRVSVNPTQARDRSMLVLGYLTAMRRFEATSLLQRDITTTPEGLAISIPGRNSPVLVRSDPGMPCDPTTAWEGWTRHLGEQDRADPTLPAFLCVWGKTISKKPIGPDGLNDIVKAAADKAGLSGDWTWTSLRWGLIRTGFRNDEPLWTVAQLADLQSLTKITKHHRREHLISRSVAAQLGL